VSSSSEPESKSDFASASSIPEPTNSGVVFKEEDQNALRQIDQQAVQVRLDLANLTLDFENKKSQIIARLMEINRVYNERLKTAAASFGYDISQGKWNFDPHQMLLTKAD
jgi:hypothetical protein